MHRSDELRADVLGSPELENTAQKGKWPMTEQQPGQIGPSKKAYVKQVVHSYRMGPCY